MVNRVEIVSTIIMLLATSDLKIKVMLVEILAVICVVSAQVIHQAFTLILLLTFLGLPQSNFGIQVVQRAPKRGKAIYHSRKIASFGKC